MPVFIYRRAVAPLAGAWIEILERFLLKKKSLVAPLAGAWIEIYRVTATYADIAVAPLAGAWIEILKELRNTVTNASLPSRERGLK